MTLIVGSFDDTILLAIIGQGSFGTVHRAMWRGLLVAAKVIPMTEDKSKVQKEIELCQLVF